MMLKTKWKTHMEIGKTGKVADDENDWNDEKRPNVESWEEKPEAGDVVDQQQETQTSIHDENRSTKLRRKLRKKRALLELRCVLEDAIRGNHLLEAKSELREISLWGVPLLPSKCHEGTDIVLMKFLKAKDFKVQESFEMLRATLMWRDEAHIDNILEENLDPPDCLKKAVYISGMDREGHPLCFHCGVQWEREIYEKKTLVTEEDCERFFRWRIKLMEKATRELSFKPGGANSFVQITDFKAWPGQSTKEFRSISKQVLMVVQEHYPEIIHRDIILNAPFWCHASYSLSSKFLNQRTKSKFVFARASNVTKTLLKFVAPESLPVEYGGLRREHDDEFLPEHKVLEHIVKRNSTSYVQIPITEIGTTVVWDLTVVGWDVSYKEEFVPEDEGSYRLMLRKHKEKKGTESVRSSCYIHEPGKIVIKIKNKASKKKKVIYRYKIKPTTPMYIFLKK